MKQCYILIRRGSMHYYNVVMGVFQPHIVSKATESEDVLPSKSPILDITKSPQELVSEYKVRLETLVRLYYLRHSFEIYDPLLVHFLSVFACAAIEDVNNTPIMDGITNGNTEQDTATNSSVILGVNGIRDQSKSCHLAHTHSFLNWGFIKTEHKWLLKEGIPAEAEINPPHMLKHTSSIFPVGIVSPMDDPEKKRLDNLIKKIVGMEVDGDIETSRNETESLVQDEAWKDGAVAIDTAEPP